MSHADVVAAIDAIAEEARAGGHELRGFTRRSGQFGYRFEARCIRCRTAITVIRVNGGWDHADPVEACPAQRADSV